ncbi:hypothetical protein CANINC_000465 [Pichia inconspicua]|uniref:Uncharacterized protein n=1 Tax=Pichia inconspicua TaxID=52247 RepID=A0A4T0X6I3_9ASCO|nr:hypothetical protein CANINC_000465 [[Candida] inconspicua]
MSHKTVNGRFNAMTLGLVGGFLIGLYLVKDYQIVKYGPPNPENFDENGNWKEGSFIKVRLKDVAPLEKKPGSEDK